MIKKFDRATARVIQAEMEAALKAIAEKHGVTVRGAGGSFDDTTFKAKFELRVTDGSAIEDAARKEFDQYCALFGLKPEHFGKAVAIPGHGKWTVCGLAMNRAKYPIKMKNEAGAIKVWGQSVVNFIV